MFVDSAPVRPSSSADASVEATIVDILATTTNIPLDGDKDEIHLHRLGIDSAEMINIIIAIEDAFDLDVEDEYIHRLRTVGDIVRAVKAAG